MLDVSRALLRTGSRSALGGWLGAGVVGVLVATLVGVSLTALIVGAPTGAVWPNQWFHLYDQHGQRKRCFIRCQ